MTPSNVKHKQECARHIDMLTKFIKLSIYIGKGNEVEVHFVGFRLWKLRYVEVNKVIK